MTKALNLIGQRFERLFVLERTTNNKNNQTQWICKCDCGKIIVASGEHLKRGGVKSCGCYKKDLMSETKSSHKKSNTRLYRIWNAIKRRCYEKNYRSFNHYGGRGISVCDEWLADFMNFYNWAIANGYREDLTIDRIDFNGNYEPNNCRWASRKEQSNNTRRNVFITYNNETHTISEWSKIIHIDSKTIQSRLKRNKNKLDRLFYKGKLGNNGVDFL